jgi:hypothetical protein
VNEGVNIPPRGPSSPLGVKFTPGGKPCCQKLASGDRSKVESQNSAKKIDFFAFSLQNIVFTNPENLKAV